MLLPRSGRFFTQDRNVGTRRHNNILDNTGTRSVRVLSAGMMSGMTSPARPWFRLSTPDPELAKVANVKEWLSKVTDMMRTVFLRSNIYRALHQAYEELAVFGTHATIYSEDYTDVVRAYPMTCGEYAIATNWRGEIVTLYREFDATVGAMVKEWGYENCSILAKSLYDRGALDQWVTIIHAIEPRADRDPSKSDAKNMAWRSCYFEIGADEGKYLSESGFPELPLTCARWQVSSGDIYGNSPGMEVLGDVKQLQQEQLRKAQAIDYQTKPPLQAPTSINKRDMDSLPGGVTYYDATSPHSGIRPQFEVRLDLNHLLADIQDVRARINSAFYTDMFLMISNQQDVRMTATEVAERHEEKLLMIGPVLERLHNELLDPLIDIVFAHMMRAGIVPPPPDEMRGMNLDVEYVSMLAQAQRAIGTNSVDRFVANLGVVAQVKPDVIDKFNADYWADSYSDMLGLDPQFVLPADGVAIIRQQRAQAAQQEQQNQQAQIANTNADTAATLAQSSSLARAMPTAGANPMQLFSGYNA